MKNKGSAEGNQEEISFVIHFNSNKSNYIHFLKNFSYKSDELWLTRVTTKQPSKLSNKLVYTRSDAYLIHSDDVRLRDISENHGFYIDEDIITDSEINFRKVPFSGISIKIGNSRYQILKLQPNSFKILFSNYELGAGASLFSQNQEELYKNKQLLLGWSTTENEMNEFFSKVLKNRVDFLVDKNACEEVKRFSINEIQRIINSSETLRGKIFNGEGLYDEPYTAWYFSQNNELLKLDYLPFTVTTGSGRTKGQYSIVLKPIA
jgi:hypothetical protein